MFYCTFVFLVSKVVELLNHISGSVCCQGNFDPEFLNLPNIHKDAMMDHSSKHVKQFIHVFLLLYLLYRRKQSCCC